MKVYVGNLDRKTIGKNVALFNQSVDVNIL